VAVIYLKLIAIGLLVYGISLAHADDRSWHFLTVTRGGVVSLVKDLTKHECEVMQDALPKKQWECAPPGWLGAEGDAQCFASVEDSDFVRAECFQ
jgi:hypothetical protein